MNARYYDPAIGQFISPDTIVPDPTVLIDYNRFAYARANPLKFVDPSGHDVCVVTGNYNCEAGLPSSAYPSNLANSGLSESDYELAQSIYNWYASNHAVYDADYAASLQGNSPASARLAHAQAYVEYFADTEFRLLSYVVHENPMHVIVSAALTEGGDPGEWGSAGAAAGVITLYRAVGPQELLNIQNTRRFNNPTGIESKYFSLTEQGARQYGGMAEKAFGDPPYRYVETSIPESSLTADMMVEVDRGVPAVIIPTHKLDDLGSPVILPD